MINLDGGQLVLGFSAQVLDNSEVHRPRPILALVEDQQYRSAAPIRRRFERVFFNDNFCWHRSVPADDKATVSLFCRSAVVMGNHIRLVGRFLRGFLRREGCRVYGQRAKPTD
ncbi:MAG: hypothetical protein U0231_12955 [Nitrospiraceae bacterium]